MAALYLHNASPQSHDRHLSNASTGASMRNSIQTISEQSHTAQPLLPHTNTHSEFTYGEIHRNMTSKEHRSLKEKLHMGRSWGDTNRRAPSSSHSRWPLRVAKRILEFILGGWAVYTTVRYFIAYTIYTGSEGQALALSMGTVSTITFALSLAKWALAALESFLTSQGLPERTLLAARTALRHTSGALLVLPALVNFILVFVWRNSTKLESRLQNRCHVDIDVVWSISSHAQCGTPPPWELWLGLSIARLVGTLVVIILYHVVITTQERRIAKARRRPVAGTSSSQAYVTQFTSLPPSFRASPGAFPQSSQAIIAGIPSPPHGRHRSLQRSHSQSTNPSPGQVAGDLPPEEAVTPLDSFSPYSSFSASTPTLPPSLQTAEDRDLSTFVDRFRSLVSQIARETEEGLQQAIRPESPPAEFDDIYGFGYGYDDAPLSGAYGSMNSVQAQQAYYSGVDEFGRPFPPEEHVRVLGGYIRRMPTIESMGSHEVTSIYSRRQSTSMYSAGVSRPPTLAGTISDASPIEGPSRANSWSASSYMRAISEAGGGAGAGGDLSRRGSLNLAEFGSTSPTTSRSTTLLSFHTAHGSSSAPSSPLYNSHPDNDLSSRPTSPSQMAE